MRVKVTRVSQALPQEPDGYSCEHYEAKGKIEIPDWAQCIWDASSGPSWTWNQDLHLKNEDCPFCRTESSCTQNVTVWPRTKTVLVVHNYKPPFPC